MSAPPKEWRRPGRGSAVDQNRQGANQAGQYGGSADLSTAANDEAGLPFDFDQLSRAQREEIAAIAFWLKRDAFQFHRRWEAQPIANPQNFVCYGQLPGRRQAQEFVWLWGPSGYLREVGEAHFSGRDVAERIARLMPGAQVLDCSERYAA